MPKATAAFLSLGLLVGILALPVFSSGQEQKAERFAIWEIVVKPSMTLKFEAALKKEIELGPPYPWMAYSTDDNFYYFTTPIENYAAIDSLFKMDAEWMAKLGDKFPEMIKSFAGTYEYYRFGVYRALPEQSYVPKKAQLKPEETKFMYWGLAYVEIGREKEFENVLKQWVDLYQEKNISMGWSTFAMEMGAEMPLYFWTESGKSAAEYFAESDKVGKKLGEEKLKELGQKTNACLRKYESKSGKPRPDLSVLPAAK